MKTNTHKKIRKDIDDTSHNMEVCCTHLKDWCDIVSLVYIERKKINQSTNI